MQNFPEVFVRGADGRERRLALVRSTEKVAFVCSIQRLRNLSAEGIEQWLVGFPLSDVRPADGATRKTMTS